MVRYLRTPIDERDEFPLDVKFNIGLLLGIFGAIALVVVEFFMSVLFGMSDDNFFSFLLYFLCFIAVDAVVLCIALAILERYML